MQMSLDGMVSTGPNDDQGWVVWALEEIYEDVLTLLDSSDTILIGRKLAVDYIPYWQDTLKRPDDPMFAFAERIVGAKKVVFSKTLDNAKWDNTVIARGELLDEVNRLKQQEGKDLIVYGGTSFVSALIKENLIDDFYFFLNPVALGKGVSVFQTLDRFRKLKLRKSTAYGSGIVLLNYSSE